MKVSKTNGLLTKKNAVPAGKSKSYGKVKLLRDSTREKSRASKDSFEARANKPVRGHTSADKRAVTPNGTSTALVNQQKVENLRQDKAYKQDTFRVHFKGDRLDDFTTTTTGNRLGGAHIDRSSWTQDQKKVSRHLSDELKSQSGFIPALNAHGTHGAEIAHVRRQAAGGLSDPLGAQPASVHYNIEDMAREEAMEKLHKKYGDLVRMKTTVYVHGDGTVKARREKIYFMNTATGQWEKKFDHLQDGHRGNIDKDEAKALKSKVSNLNPESQNVDLHPEWREIKPAKGIKPGTSVKSQADFVPPRNDTKDSPYFTDLKSGKTLLTGQAADLHMRAVLAEAAKNIK